MQLTQLIQDRHGCEFSYFFTTTPGDLIADGLYNALAVAFVWGEAHRSVSYALFAKSLVGTASVNNLRHTTKTLQRTVVKTVTPLVKDEAPCVV